MTKQEVDTALIAASRADQAAKAAEHEHYERMKPLRAEAARLYSEYTKMRRQLHKEMDERER